MGRRKASPPDGVNVTGLRLRNKTWWIDKMIGGTRIYKSTYKTDYAEAVAVFNREVSKAHIRYSTPTWALHVEELYAAKSSWLHRTHRKMVRRGEDSERGCSMTVEQLKLLLLHSNGRCQLTGIRFSDERPSHAKAAPFSYSIDRIDSTVGYHHENCRIVCFAVNMAMREWGSDVLIKIGKATLLRELAQSLGERELVDLVVDNYSVNSRYGPVGENPSTGSGGT